MSKENTVIEVENTTIIELIKPLIDLKQLSDTKTALRILGFISNCTASARRLC